MPETGLGGSYSFSNELIERVRFLAQRFFELLNVLISALLGCVSKVRKITAEKNFKLSKVTVTIDPLTFTTVSVLGFSIPVPEVNLPKSKWNLHNAARVVDSLTFLAYSIAT